MIQTKVVVRTPYIHLVKVLFLAFVSLGTSSSHASEDDEIKVILNDLTKMYSASMVYIFLNQDTINSPLADKSVLFGDDFINQVKDTYTEINHEPFPELDHFAKRILIETMIEVMDENEPLIFDEDIPFKGIIPATFAFQISAKLAAKGLGLKIKFTRISKAIRNRLNEPDEWEHTVMLNIIKKPQIFYDENAVLEGKPAIRQFTPLPMKPYCLSCHGSAKDNPLNTNREPKQWTDIDITGFKMEGWTIDDFGGGISISIDKSLFEISEAQG